MNINTAFQGKVVKPWHDLNRWLAKPYALQPDLNDPLRMAASVAIEIRHLPEKTGVDDKQARANCFAQDVIRDVADYWKHGQLDQKSRDNPRNALRASCGLRPGRNPYEHSRKSASNTDSNIRATALCSRRSSTVGMPNGLVPALPARVRHEAS